MISLYELLPALKRWEVRLFSYLLIGDGCWSWLGHTHNPDGYALFTLNAKENGGKPTEVRVHRYLYELLRGPIPDGLECDHLCRNPGCPNPEHIELVTHDENMRRRACTGLCKVGHDMAVTRMNLACGKTCCGVCYRNRLDEQRAARIARGLKKPGRRKIS